MNIKIISYIAGAAVVGVLVGRYVIKPKTEVKTKEVIKYVEVFKEKKEEKKRTRTRISERTNSDGSKETTTDITEDTDSSTVTNRDTKTESKKETIAKSGSGLTLAALAIKDTTNFSRPMEYGATVTVPVFGNLSVQGLATTDKKVGVGIAISF